MNLFRILFPILLISLHGWAAEPSSIEPNLQTNAGRKQYIQEAEKRWEKSLARFARGLWGMQEPENSQPSASCIYQDSSRPLDDFGLAFSDYQ
ncbi:MAG: hypothetical protein ACD_64C00050G0003 [uncultured bacterium]|nr:MAG: hypothetical protein ACD_64C00050G0003 [uncultured bacterium]